ncbi:MAG: SurA N-terminal domain-containing protein [Candidatus Omnitrophota bacterium]
MFKQTLLLIIILTVFFGQDHVQAQFTEKILAVVNGEAITQTDVDEILAPIYLQYKSSYQGPALIKKMETAKTDILNQLIEDKLLLQQALKQELTVDEKEIDQLVKKLESNFQTAEEFENILKTQGITLSDLKKRYKEQLLIKKVVGKEILSKILISPKEISAYYDLHKEDFKVPEQVKLRNIFIETSNVAEENLEIEKKVKDTYEQLKNGVEFVELVEKYSEAPNVVDAGEMGFMKRGSMREEIENAVFDLEPGNFTSPIKTASGYYIFKVEGKKEAQIQPMEKVQNEIRNAIFQEKSKQKLKKWIDELKESTLIEVKKDEKKR